MSEKRKKRDPYQRLRKAWKAKRGILLSAEDVDILMDDTAVRDAVLRTYEGEK